MSNMISPNDVHADPKKWLSVPHELHDVIGSLMEKMYSDWHSITKDIVCLRCSGHDDVEVEDRETGAPMVVTGYILKDGVVDWMRIQTHEEYLATRSQLSEIINSDQ